MIDVNRHIGLPTTAVSYMPPTPPKNKTILIAAIPKEEHHALTLRTTCMGYMIFVRNAPASNRKRLFEVAEKVCGEVDVNLRYLYPLEFCFASA